LLALMAAARALKSKDSIQVCCTSPLWIPSFCTYISDMSCWSLQSSCSRHWYWNCVCWQAGWDKGTGIGRCQLVKRGCSSFCKGAIAYITCSTHAPVTASVRDWASDHTPCMAWCFQAHLTDSWSIQGLHSTLFYFWNFVVPLRRLQLQSSCDTEVEDGMIAGAFTCGRVGQGTGRG
jgi:hypothetical protein